VLIDPSSDRKRLTHIRDVHGVREIWLSHWHEDHFMHLVLFDDLPLCISEPDAPPLADLDLLLDWYGDQYLRIIDEREKKLLTLLEKPKTLEEISRVGIVYGKQYEPNTFFASGERLIIEKHLRRFKGCRLISEKGGKYFRI